MFWQMTQRKPVMKFIESRYFLVWWIKFPSKVLRLNRQAVKRRNSLQRFAPTCESLTTISVRDIIATEALKRKGKMAYEGMAQIMGGFSIKEVEAILEESFSRGD
jgi:hypothetical protein